HLYLVYCFFFQAEDGIRDFHVTGVQTCALPISDDLALTVALAIFIIVVWANLLGSVLPLLAIRLRIDPTVVSGPVMSTLVDATEIGRASCRERVWISVGAA